jgi:hypothetical protein
MTLGYNQVKEVIHMAEAHKFSTLDKATEAYPDLPWKANGDGQVWVYDEKSDQYVPVEKGQFIYKVGERYEVRDTGELPKSAKPALPADEKAVEKAKAAKEEAKAEAKADDDK